MSRGERPLLKGKSPEELRSFITAQLAEREPYYMKARYVVDIDVLDSTSKINGIVRHIKQYLNL